MMGELPQGWVEARLERIVDSARTGIVRSTADQNTHRGHPYVRMNHYDTVGRWRWDKLTFVDVSTEEAALYELRAHDLLFNTRNSVELVGKVALWLPGKTGHVYNNNLIRLRLVEGANAAFFCYQMMAPAVRDELERLKSATTSVAAIYQRDLWGLRVYLAPLPEQRRIVAAIEQHFSRLDAAVATLERVKAKLGQTRASVLKAAVEGRLVPTEAAQAAAEGRDYEHASVLLERILAERRERWEQAAWEKVVEKAKQKAAKAHRKAQGRPLQRGEKLAPAEWEHLTEDEYRRYLPKNDRWKAKYKEPVEPDVEGLPVLPEGWVWSTVDTLCDLIRGASPRPKGDPRYFGGPIPWITIRDVSAMQGKYLLRTKEGVTEAGAAKSRLLRQGTLILSNSGSICVPCILGIEGCIHDGWVALTDLSSGVLPLYLYHFFDQIRPAMKRKHRQGMTQVNLNTTIVRSIEVPLPPLAEQHRIVAEVDRQLSVLDEVGRLVDANLARCARLRQAILKRAFEGRLVPQDPNDEPASALLERIKAQTAATPKQTNHRRKSRKGTS